MANLRPQGPLFDAASTAVSRMAQQYERGRANASYIAAALLAIPIGLLPLVLSRTLADILNAPLNGQLFRVPAMDSHGSIYMVAALIISLGFIVLTNVLADRQYNQMLESSSQLLSGSTLSMLILDSNTAREMSADMKRAVLPETLSHRGGESINELAAFYALYHDTFHRKALGKEHASMAMLIRQDMVLNLLLALVTSLACYALVGYLILPWVLLRIFRNWPRVSACQTAFAHYISLREHDR